MISTSDYAGIAIFGGGVESYWAALAFARQLPLTSGSLCLYDDPKLLQPALCVGAWLEELHDFLGVSHEDFLRVLQPRLSLGLEVTAASKSFFVSATQAGFSYKHCSFSRLYAALADQVSSAYAEFNYASILHKNSVAAPPHITNSLLCEGLGLVYQFDGVRYKQFLLHALNACPLNVIPVDAAVLQRDEAGAVVALSSDAPPLATDIMVIDICWSKNVNPVKAEAVKSQSAGFFAINQLRIENQHYFRRFNYAGNWTQLYQAGRGELGEGLIDSNEFWLEGQIRLGVGGLDMNMAAIIERIFYRQLRGLLAYWPRRENFAVLAKKFNREWLLWHQESHDYQSLILYAVGTKDELSPANLRRIELFRETGVVPQQDGAIFSSSEWENVLVAGLAIEPGYRPLPRDITQQEGLDHLQQIKKSYFESIEL